MPWIAALAEAIVPVTCAGEPRGLAVDQTASETPRAFSRRIALQDVLDLGPALLQAALRLERTCADFHEIDIRRLGEEPTRGEGFASIGVPVPELQAREGRQRVGMVRMPGQDHLQVRSGFGVASPPRQYRAAQRARIGVTRDCDKLQIKQLERLVGVAGPRQPSGLGNTIQLCRRLDLRGRRGLRRHRRCDANDEARSEDRGAPSHAGQHSTGIPAR